MQKTKRAKDRSDVALVEKTHALDEKTVALSEKTQALYYVRIPLADRELAAGNTEEAERLLDACPPEHRQWEWHYLKRQCHNKELLDPSIAFAPGPLSHTEPVFTANGHRLNPVRLNYCCKGGRTQEDARDRFPTIGQRLF